MDSIIQAFSSAAPVWEQAVLKSTWYHAVIVLAYLGAAWLCLLNGHIAKAAQEGDRIWYLAAVALCLLGVNTVLHGDIFLTHFVRALAKMEGWYVQRRWLQYGLVALLAPIILLVAVWLRSAFSASDVPSESVALGLALVLIIVSVRTVSAHGTDAVLNFHLAGVSFGRLLEFAGIGLVMHGALKCLRLR
jgi:hypothetical protein